MILLFLHGPPACGKYTVGRALVARAGFSLMHNHEVVDDVLSRHAFGTPGFVAERDRAWRTQLGVAARDPQRRVVFTFNPENSVPQAFVDWLFAEVPAHGGVLQSVALSLSEPEIEARLASESRRAFHKLTDVALYRQLRDTGVFAQPTIPRTDLTIDTGTVSAAEAAEQIVARFGLEPAT